MRYGIFVLMFLSAPLTLPHAQAADAIVVMKNFDYSPMDVTVTPGSTVTWKNLDGEPHTVASVDGTFHSPALDQGDTYQFKFDRPGVYKYICSIHPKMRATVTVK
ncbi:MAG TPA: plastocyanin/azurin family copper-binding protein [Rhizomicrobium sp.]|nr:plastocyanin/azurin family copper-binding protein [Rhizomicrobium sp.]